MASPVVASRTGGGSTGTTHAVTMPSSIASGDLLVMVFGGRESPTVTKPTNWTLLEQGSGTNTTIAVMYKVADETEGASEDVITSTSQTCCWETYRITGSNDVPESETSYADTDETACTPAAITPTTGSQDYLFICGCFRRDGTAPSTYPTNYIDTGYRVSGSALLAIGKRPATVTTETPGDFTFSNGADYSIATVAIPPTGAGGGGSTIPPLMHHYTKNLA